MRHQESIDESIHSKQLGDIQKRNKLRNCDGQNQNGSPQLLEADSLLVDQHGHRQTEEVINKGCKERPDKSPAKNRQEGVSEAGRAEAEQIFEILQSHPGKQIGRGLMLLVIVCEGNTDHENNRQNRKYENSKRRKCQKRFVKMLIQQRVKCLTVRGKSFSLLQPKLLDHILTDIHSPDKEKGSNQNDGQNSEEQNQKAVVSVHGLAADFLCRYRSKRRNLAYILPAELNQVEEEQNFRSQKCKSLDHLTAKDRPEAHHHIGNSGFPVSVCKCRPDFTKILSECREERSHRIFLRFRGLFCFTHCVSLRFPNHMPSSPRG